MTAKLEFGQDCVFFDGADSTNIPMLAKALVIARDGAVCDLVVFPPVNGPCRVMKNVRHVDDPHYEEFHQQKRFGGFCTTEEHKAKLAQRLAAKREADLRRERLEQEAPATPRHIAGVESKETPEEILTRLHGQGRIAAFICEIIDSPEWPLDRVTQYMAKLDGVKEKPAKSKKEKEPALA